MTKRPTVLALAATAILSLGPGFGLVRAALGTVAAAGPQSAPAAAPGAAELAAELAANLASLRAQFARPTSIPYPGAMPPTPEQVALGARLFHDPRLSANGEFSCASCHDPELAFTDGVTRGMGIAKALLPRHTPTLWNLAWNETLFWDGRAPSLEAQAQGPMENPKEMGQAIGAGVAKLRADPAMLAAFAAAFPDRPDVSPTHVLTALADYERTLVSPPTRFDAFIAGDDTALTPSERNGFALFTGRGRCSTCHSGWAFTDRAFHDIGLPTDDKGRGTVIGLPAVNYAFKTPTLRELSWTAPYMHDGSLASLEDVVSHYNHGGVDRPSRSPDLPVNLALTGQEVSDLVAFLETLSSARPPKPDAGLGFSGVPVAVAAPVTVSQVTQKNKAFSPTSVRVTTGETLRIVNDDTRPHNVRVFDPRLEFNSGLQEPGETATITFGSSGTFEVFCGIHPSMKLSVTVE